MLNKELCIRCNKPTPYHPNTPITLRRYYIEGSGQLCPLCYQNLFGVAPSLEISGGGGLDEKEQTSGARKEEKIQPGAELDEKAGTGKEEKTVTDEGTRRATSELNPDG